MKYVFIALLILGAPYSGQAQNQSDQFGTCFAKKNRKSISQKMENFLARVSAETNCPKEQLSYTVTEYYTGFYSKPCRHLPKKITFDVCGKKRTYMHQGLSGNITYWLLGSWTLVEEK